MDEMKQLPLWSKLFRYFIHGAAFSILFLILTLIWIFIFAFLIVIGSFLGLIIGFIVLFFFMGGLNTFLTRWIWSTDIRSDWLSLFIHGLGLFFALLIAALPMFFLTGFFLAGTPYSLPLSIVLFVPYRSHRRVCRQEHRLCTEKTRRYSLFENRHSIRESYLPKYGNGTWNDKGIFDGERSR